MPLFLTRLVRFLYSRRQCGVQGFIVGGSQSNKTFGFTMNHHTSVSSHGRWPNNDPPVWRNALTTRLMQISLAMDDHIYCGKMITASEAGGYLQEIATLKLRCLPTNVRALQVIEKLTRCMRSILAEDTEHAGNSFNQFRQMSSELAEPASPVYSLPEEDKTYNTDDQNGDENVNNISKSGEDELSKKQSTLYIIKDSNCQNNVTTRSKVQYLSDPKPTLDDIQIIDITNTSDTDEPKDIDAVFKEKDVSVENVNAEMFNMSIQDEIFFQLPVGDRDCSQSILDNYDNENSNVAREETVFERVSYNKIDTQVLVVDKINNYFAQHTPTSNTCQKLPNSQPTEVELNVNKEPAKPTQPSSLKNKNKRVRKKKKVANRKDERVSKKNSKHSYMNGQNYQQNLGNTIMTSYATCNDKENVPKTVKKKNRPNKKACGIYNENVENDLSWVENIRYVREISPEEHDPALSLLPDNFWDNFALPDKWDDLDFE